MAPLVVVKSGFEYLIRTKEFNFSLRNDTLLPREICGLLESDQQIPEGEHDLEVFAQCVPLVSPELAMTQDLKVPSRTRKSEYDLLELSVPESLVDYLHPMIHMLFP